MAKPKLKERQVYYDFENSKNPQIDALRKLGFEYIIVGEQRKRLYAFFEVNSDKLSKYATYNGIALNTNLFPEFVIEKLDNNTFYKI